jgi:putative ABC transport system permease protein
MAFDRFPLALPDRVAKQAQYWRDFEERLSALPGVTSVGAGGTFPLNELPPFNTHLVRESHPLPPGQQPPEINVRIATPQYFSTLGQPLLAGRVFTVSDVLTATPVAIINQTAAKQYWPNENPVGTRIENSDGGAITIVGVVADVRQQLDRAPGAEVYVPLQQSPLPPTTWIVKTELPAAEVERAVRAVAHAHDADLPVSNFRTLADVRSMTLTPRRAVVALIGLFGVLALVITATGIAGVVAFSVNQRTQEFGIRMALGAQRTRVLSLVLREGIVLVVIGLAIGAAGAVVLTRMLGRMLISAGPPAGGPLLFQVPPVDIVTYLGVAATLILVALAACAVPARRAASVDPLVALRAQ